MIAGAALVLLVVWDIGLTLLHPSERGPLSYVVNRMTWRTVRAISTAISRRRLLTFAGPLTLAFNVAAWLALLWIGFALIHLPYIEQYSYTPGVPFGDRGIAEALYVSGVSLTTVGFGDVVAPTDLLRGVSILEAASGLGAFTAAITYILAVYPLVTALRSHALHVYDLGVLDAEGATRVVLGARETELARLTRDLVESHEHVKRFPILYYFESGNESESFGTMLKGSGMVCLVVRWGLAREALGHASFYGHALERSLGRILEDLENDFIGGRRQRAEPGEPLDEDDAARRLARLREAVAEVEPGAEASGDDAGDEDFADFVTHLESVLSSLAHEHRHEFEPLLAAPARAAA